MFATIRKHQTWLWGFIIAAVIVSFVIYFTPSASRDRSDGRRSAFGTMNGKPIGRQEYYQAWIDARLEFYLRYGEWPDAANSRRSGFNAERETRNRLVLIDRLKALNIQIEKDAVAQWIVETFGGNQPATAKAKYDNFTRELRQGQNITEEEFQNYIRHRLGIAHMASVASVAGKLVTPRSAADQFRQENEKVEAEAVIFSASNYVAGVKLDPTALIQYYSNRLSVYRIPDRVQLHYLKFDLTNYLAQAEQNLAANTNLALEIDRAYLASNPSAFTDTNGQVLPPDVAKARIRDRERDRQALIMAHRAAAQFATNFETMTNLTGEAFITLAANKGLATGVTEPFAETDSPRAFKVRANVAEVAFKLTAKEPVLLSPIRGEDGVYLIALKQRFPSEVPAFDTVRARVELEYRQEEALKLARNAGLEFAGRLTNGLAQGKTFASLAAEAKLNPVPLPKFSLASRTVPNWDRRIDLNQAKNAIAGVEPGHASALVNARDGCFILGVKAREAVTEEELKKELPAYLANLRQNEEYAAFNDWFRRQVELARIDTLKGKEESE